MLNIFMTTFSPGLYPKCVPVQKGPHYADYSQIRLRFSVDKSDLKTEASVFFECLYNHNEICPDTYKEVINANIQTPFSVTVT